jgi:hypothetical protein
MNAIKENNKYSISNIQIKECEQVNVYVYTYIYVCTGVLITTL